MMQEYRSTDGIYTKRYGKNRCLIIGGVIVAITAFIIGILIGRFAACPDDKPEVRDGVFLPGVSKALIEDGDPAIRDVLINGMNSENIRENLRKLTAEAHIAGQETNHELGRDLKDQWLKDGLDHVTMTPYHVMLSYPNETDLNYVELLDGNDVTKYKSDLREPFLTPEENKTNVVPPFNAYSAPGDITGDLVYVNYGRVEDFLYLKNVSVNVTGKIAIARYGKIFRGDKVHHAEINGAIGIILFSDPEDYTSGDINQVYPNDWWLPPSGAQRGTVYTGDGDPETADYPSIETAFREVDGSFYLPKIPCHPIGYGIAIELMRAGNHVDRTWKKWRLSSIEGALNRAMGGDEVIPEWQGGMNVTYKYGGSFNISNWRAHIHVTTSSKSVITYNTIGILKGSIEPDRYVLIGNHRDAWVFGALDPSSGTAVMSEMVRVMGNLVKSGRWRPRRSILFCSWGAEEYGLIGSTEWVEHYTKSLGARAVAYLNVDIAVQGNFSLRALGTPLIHKVLFEATKSVPNPNQTEVAAGRNTVYDTWLHTFPSDKHGYMPTVSLPGSGSDYAPFRDRIGIPVVDVRYTWNSNKLKLSSYPMYHSVYETFYLVDKIVDRGFKYHTAIGQVWGEMARQLADELIIPFNVSDYAMTLHDLYGDLIKQFGPLLSQNVETDLLLTSIQNFTTQAAEFEGRKLNVNKNDPMAVRKINDQLMQLDRAFIDPAGLPGRRLKRHILFAESIEDNYAGSSFPGIADSLSRITQEQNVTQEWKTVKKHFSVLLFTIQSATSVMRDVSDFMVDYD